MQVSTSLTLSTEALQVAQQSPVKPKAAPVIRIKPELATTIGISRRCFRQPGTNATIAITKHANAIH